MDAIAVGGEGRRCEDAAIDEAQDRGLAVEARNPVGEQAGPLVLEPHQHAGDAIGADEDAAHRRRLATAVADESGLLVEQGEQRVAIVVAQCREKALEQSLLDVAGDGEARAILADSFAGAVDHLSRGGYAPVDDAGDLVVVGVEQFAEKKGGALLGAEALEQHEKRDGEIGLTLDAHVGRAGGARLGASRNRLREPLSDVAQALGLGAMQPVDREAGHDGDEPAVGADDRCAIRRLPAEPALLHEILRFVRITEHAIADAEESRPESLEDVEKLRGGCHNARPVPSMLMSDHSTETIMTKRIDISRVGHGAYQAMAALEQHVRKSGLEQKLLELVRLRASYINGCAYCIDMHSKDARAEGETEQRIYSVPVWHETPYYTPRERAALEWTEVVTNISQHGVPDDVYAAARKEFSEEELVELTLAVITINGWNRVSIAFGVEPGSYVRRG